LITQSNIQNFNKLPFLVASRIAQSADQCITFADYMSWALYEPELGYYTAQRQKIGAGGDFVTSPHLGADFGELLAEQFLDLWISLERPSTFQVIEMGAGQGLIAADVLRYLRDQSSQPGYMAFWKSLEYIIIEKAAVLIAEQQHKLKAFAAAQKVTWTTWEEIPGRSVVGCFFSNELVDAFPVHRIEIQSGKVQEVFVGISTPPSALGITDKTERTDEFKPKHSAPPHPSPPLAKGREQDLLPVSPLTKGGLRGVMQDMQEVSNLQDCVSSIPIQFTEIVAEPSTPALQEYLEKLDLDIKSYPDGYRSEINLAALDWLTTAAQKLAQGYVLTIDYGYTAAQYYSRQRPQGTLQCYYQQAHHEDPYWAVGQQDITAHVNFTALEQQGKMLGLQNISYVQQGLFLMALGLGDRLNQNAANSAANFMDILRKREALHALMNPLGLGGFGVLLQGTANTPNLEQYLFKGFSEPSPINL
jgi:SAM-dependent MidA family methyltransferase